VLLAAGAFSVELAASGRSAAFLTILGWMVLVHAAIGLGEAVITGLVLRFVLMTRPDLIEDLEPGAAQGGRRWGQVATAGLAIALAVAVVLGPFALDRPDGLEYVGKKLGFLAEGKPPVIAALFPEYEVRIPGLSHVKLMTAAAGVLGTVIVFGVGVGLARTFVRREPGGIGPDAA
jgi:cobalt/nickel transport system permease protein